MESFLKNVYGIIVNPKVTIAQIAETKPVGQAFFLVVLLSLISAVLGHKTGFDGSLDFIFFLSNFVAILVSSLIIWLSLAGFFALSAWVFRDDKHFRKMLALMGFALLPWVFTAPLLFAKSNEIFLVISIILEIAIWAWSIVLVFLSVQNVYELSVRKTALFLLTPLLGIIVMVNWISQVITIIAGLF